MIEPKAPGATFTKSQFNKIIEFENVLDRTNSFDLRRGYRVYRLNNEYKKEIRVYRDSISIYRQAREEYSTKSPTLKDLAYMVYFLKAGELEIQELSIDGIFNPARIEERLKNLDRESKQHTQNPTRLNALINNLRAFTDKIFGI